MKQVDKLKWIKKNLKNLDNFELEDIYEDIKSFKEHKKQKLENKKNLIEIYEEIQDFRFIELYSKKDNQRTIIHVDYIAYKKETKYLNFPIVVVEGKFYKFTYNNPNALYVTTTSIQYSYNKLNSFEIKESSRQELDNYLKEIL